MDIYGADISGIDGHLVKFSTVKETRAGGVRVLGLAGKVVREGIERAIKAIETMPGNYVLGESGYTFDLDPAETPKQSSGLDLPIAIMLLQASILDKNDSVAKEMDALKELLGKHAESEVKRAEILEKLEQLEMHQQKIKKYRERLSKNTNKYLLIGKLDIVSGALITPQFSMFGMMAAARSGFTIVIPESSGTHGALIAKAIKGVKVWTATSLDDVWNMLLGVKPPKEAIYDPSSFIIKDPVGYRPNLKAIKGVGRAKLAMEVALAGGHNLLMVGPPGQGKSMLAKAASDLLPAMTQAEMFEVNKIYSARGELRENEVVVNRPYQEVNGSATEAALFGGGSGLIRPGLVSLAHKGVLLFDEINLCRASVIEKLRNPLNNKMIQVQRVAGFVEYPCNFVFVAAMNPCKCGWLTHNECPHCNYIIIDKTQGCPFHSSVALMPKCRCTPSEVRMFRDKLSKPIMDRIDLKVFVSEYDGSPTSRDISTHTVKTRIKQARNRQGKRYQSYPYISCNGDVPDQSHIGEVLDKTREKLNEILTAITITKRLETKLFLVSRTIADLAGEDHIRPEHVESAVDLMGLKHAYFQ